MKKIFFLAAVAALAFVGCNKNNDPVAPQKDLVYEGPAQVVIEEGTNFYSVKFKANANWEAKVEVPGEEEALIPSVTIDKTEGAAGEQTVKVTFEDLADGQTGRLAMFAVSTKGWDNLPEEGQYFMIAFIQGKVFVVAPHSDDTATAAGGKVVFQIITNCGYEVKKYDEFEAWAPATIADNYLTFDIKSNAGYDARQAYVKFTINEIQVPAYDSETGEPAGTKAYEVRAYANQEGLASMAWLENIDERLDHTLAGKMSIAVFAGDVYVCDGVGIFTFNKETGAYKSQLDASVYGNIVPRCITTDDAGHLLVAGEGTYQEKVEAYLLKDASSGEKFLSFYVDSYGGGSVSKYRVSGDLTGKATVVAFYNGLPSYDGVTYACRWQVSGGRANWAKYGEGDEETTQPEFFVMSNVTGDVWDPNGFCVAPVGSDVADGLYYMGYESPFTFQQYDGASWTAKFTGASQGNHGYSSIDVITWNGKKYISVVEMAYFPFWGESSNLWLVNADNNYEILSTGGVVGEDIRCNYDWETYSTTGMTVSADAEMVIENGNLAVYVVDGGQNVMYKKVFAPLAK